MPIEANHRTFRPIRLKDVISFLECQIPFDQSLLVHMRDGVLGTQRSREVFKDPLRRACQPRHRLLLFEVPIEEITSVAFRPVAFAERNGLPAIEQMLALPVSEA